jgi:quercetin dioxygenase-like cupin family protein
MKFMSSRTVTVCALAVFIGVAGLHVLYGQQAPTVTRNVLMKQDTTIPGREAVMIAVQLQSGAAAGRHTHPAELFVFVQEGTISLENEDKPTVTYNAGDVFYVAPGKIHNAINNGTVTAKLSAILIAENGKPLSSPAK